MIPFICTICGQLSDDGDILMEQCMDCCDSLCDMKVKDGFFVRRNSWFFVHARRWTEDLQQACHFEDRDTAERAARLANESRRFNAEEMPEAIIVEVR